MSNVSNVMKLIKGLIKLNSELENKTRDIYIFLMFLITFLKIKLCFELLFFNKIMLIL